MSVDINLEGGWMDGWMDISQYSNWKILRKQKANNSSSNDNNPSFTKFKKKKFIYFFFNFIKIKIKFGLFHVSVSVYAGARLNKFEKNEPPDQSAGKFPFKIFCCLPFFRFF